MPRIPREVDAALLGASRAASPDIGAGTSEAARIPAGSQPTPSPPSLEHIEQRGVSAAFLTQLTASQLTFALKCKATAEAIAFLNREISKIEHELEQARIPEAFASNSEPELEPEPEPEPGQSVQEAFAGLGRNMSRQMSALDYSKKNVVGMLERDLAQHREDLNKRQSEPYLTSRDVHKLLVVAQTKERMCRYVELPDVHTGEDEAGQAWIGEAQYFFSYSWDSPWDSVVSALQAHTRRQVAAGKPPPYYWIDIFAVNQHTRDAVHNGRSLCGACSTCRANKWDPLCDACVACACQNCAGCIAVGEDMHDWATADPNHLKGFERVIAHTGHTLVLNEPWDSPRPPTRVWCLFEGYQTLARGGELEVVLDETAQQEMHLSLGDRFRDLQGIVDQIDARLADATVARDRDNIFGAIEHFQGGFDGLNAKMQRAQLRWLCDTAQLVIERTDPQRPQLDAATLALEVVETGDRWGSLWMASTHGGAKLTALLEWLPRLPPLLILLGWLMVVSAIVVLCIEDEGWVLGKATFGPLLVFGCIFTRVGNQLTEHQAKRQLRRPTLLGNWVTRRVIGIQAKLKWLAVFAGVVALVGQDSIVEVGLVALFVAAFAVWQTLQDAYRAAIDRALLRTKAGWMQLRQGDAEGAAAQLGEAQAELLDVIGPNDVFNSWLVAPALCRALCEAGRIEEIDEVAVSCFGCRQRPVGVLAWVSFVNWNARADWRICAQEMGDCRVYSKQMGDWIIYGDLLRASMAAGAHASDDQVLSLLEAAVRAKCWVPAGSRPMNYQARGYILFRAYDYEDGATEGGQLEWEEFLGRMAASDGVTPANRRRWEAYRDQTIQLASARWARGWFKGVGLRGALISRGLPSVGEGESLEDLRARLMASLFEHPAYAYVSNSPSPISNRRRENRQLDELRRVQDASFFARVVVLFYVAFALWIVVDFDGYPPSDTACAVVCWYHPTGYNCGNTTNGECHTAVLWSGSLFVCFWPCLFVLIVGDCRRLCVQKTAHKWRKKRPQFKFEKNAFVLIHSLRNNVDCNGAIGLIVDHVPTKDRYRVLLSDGQKGLISDENLSPLSHGSIPFTDLLAFKN
eukprot:COSAG02_NODE_877_length_16272_cov_8.002288_1_plen_1086_part_00